MAIAPAPEKFAKFAKFAKFGIFAMFAKFATFANPGAATPAGVIPSPVSSGAQCHPERTRDLVVLLVAAISPRSR